MAQDVIVGWQVYSLTKSVLMLGLIGLAEAIPAILCSLFAGHFVDNGKPYKIFFTCFGIICLNALVLFLIAGGVVPTSPNNIIITLFVGIFISGVVRSFLMPTSFKFLSQIVNRESISSAAAWFTTSFQVAAISGPAIAGLVYGGYGAFYAWLMPVSLVFVGFIITTLMSKRLREYQSKNEREPAIQSIKAGWKFIFKNQALFSIMVLDMFAVLFGGAIAMLPAFADQVLHVGSQGLGILRAGPAIGSIIMALFMALYPLKKVRGSLMFPAVAGFGLSMIAFGFSKVFWMAMLFLILSGMFDSVSMVLRSTLMQLLTPDEMRGRVSAIGSMFVISSNEIGAFESGVAASLLGLVPSIIFGGVGTLFVVTATFFLAPQLRNIVINPNEGKNEA